MDAHTRHLLLNNALVQRVLALVEREGLSPEAAAARELERRREATVSDETLLAVERALSAAIARLPPGEVGALNPDGPGVAMHNLDAFFASVLPVLEHASAGSKQELERLGVAHLRDWQWERDVVAWRRFLASGNRDHDALAQRPVFWRPDVEHRPFWPLEELPEGVRALEAAAPEILEELSSLRREGAWLPYRGVGRHPVHQPVDDEVSGCAWNAFFFYHPFHGRFDANHARCPATSRALEAVEGLCRRELVFFSALAPGAVVPPHCGPFNGRLRVHLALTGSEGCYLRVGTQIRPWQDGKVLAFDDSLEHQVFHGGSQMRVVLLFNLVQPGVPASALEPLAVSNPVRYLESDEDRQGRERLARERWWR